MVRLMDMVQYRLYVFRLMDMVKWRLHMVRLDGMMQGSQTDDDVFLTFVRSLSLQSFYDRT